MKTKLREKIMLLRDAHEGQDVRFKSHEIKKRLFELLEFRKAKIVMLYVALKGEVKTRAIIQESLAMGKRVVVPVTDFEKKEMKVSEIKSFSELEETKKGLYEPKKEFFREVSPAEIDIVIVPGLAFDSEGDRVGYGYGFYDNFLPKIKENILTIGLAFEFQIVYNIPTEKYDVSIKKIITEKRIIDIQCGKCLV